MQNINVNIVPDSYPQTIRYSQGDVGREFKINVVGFTIPTGATVKIQATKPSGFGFSVAGTVAGNAVSFTTTAIMTDEAGRFPAELEITKDSVVIGTANFIMWGEANPHPEGTTDGQQGTIIPELTLLVERVEAAASSVLDMEVVANTLPAGSQATYSYDEDLNKATFGIPQGEAGAGAAGVVADAYSSSKTYKVGDYVLHNSNLYRCTTAITTAEAFTAAHWTQIVLANDVSDLKTDFSNMSNGILSDDYYKRTPYATANDWKLVDSGASASDSNYKIIKYQVVAGIDIYVWCFDHNVKMQFQSNASVPADSNPYIIGNPISDGYCGKLSVPTGAKYIILSAKKTDTLSGVYYNESKLKGTTSRFILEKLIPNAIADGYKVRDNGASVSDSSYEIRKFAVSESDEIHVINNHIFQFQNSPYVPTDSNPYVIGETYTEPFNDNIIVPEGATYLIISLEKSDDESGMYAVKPYKSTKNVSKSVNPTLIAERYIGHRGGGKTAPENTIPSLNQGYENGFKIFEVDIQFTSDNVPVVLHDTTINRTGRNADGTTIGSTINIGDITYEDSQDYDFGIWKGSEYAGTKLPKLDDVLLWAKKHGCCIECDLYGTENMTKAKAKILYDLVTSRGMNGSVMFTAPYTSTLLYFDGLEDICVCCTSVGQTESYAQEASTFLQKSMYTMCSVQYPYLTDAQVEYVHKHGMVAKGFTITSNEEANSVWANGVDKMILDGIYPSEIS